MKKAGKKKISVVLGTRPNFIKAAAFFIEAKKRPHFKIQTIHTGQHFDKNMSDVFFRDMKLPEPDIFLDIKETSPSQKIGKMIGELKKIFRKNKCDAVLVFGDVNSTLAAAVAATKTKLIHVESGLRSNDHRMPEEMNRIITDHLSDLLFITEPSAEKNLIGEGIDKKKIKYVGNIMIESLERFQKQIDSSSILSELKLVPQEYIVVTIHRRENTEDLSILKKIMGTIKKMGSFKKIVFPVHPGTKQKIIKAGLEKNFDEILAIDPLSYFDFMKLVCNSSGVITDSGGIQEETSHLGIPCATLRDNTERPITIELGSNKLFPIQSLDDSNIIIEHLKRSDFPKKNIPLWDSEVSRRIFDFLEKELF